MKTLKITLLFAAMAVIIGLISFKVIDVTWFSQAQAKQSAKKVKKAAPKKGYSMEHPLKVFEAEKMKYKSIGGLTEDKAFWSLWGTGKIEDTYTFPKTAQYIIRIRAYGAPAGGVKPDMEISIDGKGIETVHVKKTTDDYFINTAQPKGKHKLSVAFTNDATIGKEDRDLNIDKIFIYYANEDQ